LVGIELLGVLGFLALVSIRVLRGISFAPGSGGLIASLMMGLGFYAGIAIVLGVLEFLLLKSLRERPATLAQAP
jgi:hypothetical protein